MLEENGFFRGVNLGGWLSQCDYSEDRLNNFIQEGDIKKIASWKLDHVRIPVDYNVLEEDAGIYREDGFAHIDRAIEWCKKYNLNIVLDLHKTAGFSFDFGEKEIGFFESEKLQERFYLLWEEIARRYGKYSDFMAFELLNEVTDEIFIDKWNNIANECIRRIREITSDTIILVGSYNNNSVMAVKDLAKPYDNRVVYNFHCYDPLKYTHQGAYWTDAIDKDARFSFEESGVDYDYYADLFKSAIESAKNNNTELYCGEYGVIDVISPEDTLKWYKTVSRVLNDYGISRSAWSYKEMDFGLSDARLDCVRDELISYL